MTCTQIARTGCRGVRDGRIDGRAERKWTHYLLEVFFHPPFAPSSSSTPPRRAASYHNAHAFVLHLFSVSFSAVVTRRAYILCTPLAVSPSLILLYPPGIFSGCRPIKYCAAAAAAAEVPACAFHSVRPSHRLRLLPPRDRTATLSSCRHPIRQSSPNPVVL